MGITTGQLDIYATKLDADAIIMIQKRKWSLIWRFETSGQLSL